MRLRLTIATAFVVAIGIAAFATFYLPGESAAPAAVVPSMSNDELLADLGEADSIVAGCPIPAERRGTFVLLDGTDAYYFVRDERIEIVCVASVPQGPAQ